MEPMTLEEFYAAREAEDILRHKRLRDEFAMAALPSAYMSAAPADSVGDIARRAYQMADAMMAERDR